MLQGVTDEAPQRVAHLARLTGSLLGGGALPLSLLKVGTHYGCGISLLVVFKPQALSARPLRAVVVGGRQRAAARLGCC
jgi:hypothetical protein